MRKIFITMLAMLISSQAFSAELLVMRDDHWSAKVSAEKKATWTAEQKEMFDSEMMKGDVLRVMPDGACPEKPAPNSRFYIIKIPGLSVKDAQEYLESDVDLTDPEHPKTKKMRKKSIDLDKLSAKHKGDLAKDKWITINNTDITKKIKAK